MAGIPIHLNGCEKLPVVSFDSVQRGIPEIDLKVLIKDVQYLLDFNTVIQLGNCPEELAVHDPGPLSHFNMVNCGKQRSQIVLSCDKFFR